MLQIIKKTIKAYQLMSALFLPKTCRFHPSCSEYTLQALDKYGIAGGVKRGLGRIVRCSPFSPGGYDPL